MAEDVEATSGKGGSKRKESVLCWVKLERGWRCDGFKEKKERQLTWESKKQKGTNQSAWD